MQEIRKNTSVTGGKMFFSYAETIDNYSEFAAFLNEMIKPRHNNNKGVTEQEPVLCKEACELFPDKIISKK